MSNKTTQLQQLIQPIVEIMGVDFVGVEYLPQGKHAVIRVYVESPKGVSIQQCGDVSKEIGRVLDVEWQTHAPYYLEVSSPGMDRRLFSKEQCERYIGRKITIKLQKPVANQRQFVGELTSVDADNLSVTVADNTKYVVAFSNATKVNLYVDWSAVLKEKPKV